MAKLVRPKRAIILKSPREIELMRVAGNLVYRVLSEVRKRAAPDVTTGQLNTLAEKMIDAAGAKALFKGVTQGFSDSGFKFFFSVHCIPFQVSSVLFRRAN